MSYHEYIAAKELRALDPPFYSLLMAAMYAADTKNKAKLRAAWPDLWDETYARYHAPEGALEGEMIYVGEGVLKKQAG